eukprot:8283_1
MQQTILIPVQPVALSALNLHTTSAQITAKLANDARNTVLTTVSQMIDNMQQIIVSYNKAFCLPLQSITNSISNYSAIQQIQPLSSECLWSSLSLHITNCIMLKQQMFADIAAQQRLAETHLSNIQQAILVLQQQSMPQIQTVETQPVTPIHVQNISVHSSQISHSTPTAVAVSNSTNNTVTKPSNVHAIPNSMYRKSHSNRSNVSVDKPITKPKRTRRGYNGPYSEDEQRFMRNWKYIESPQDIIQMSRQMEDQFKVKRSPYGLSQKMYQLGLINSRLKAIFQRQLEKKTLSENETHNENNAIEDQSGAQCTVRFRTEEVVFIRNTLMKNHNDEAPRKLYWRFTEKFPHWKDITNAYQKFYHKYWTLSHEMEKKRRIPLPDISAVPRKKMKFEIV